MVQILVHVRPADSSSQRCYELLECSLDTRVGDVKRMIEELGAAEGRYILPAASQELVFMGERCTDDKALQDYGICHTFVKQVTGFTVNPATPGQRFVEGRLVPCE